MRRATLRHLVLSLLVVLSFYSCKDDSDLTIAPPVTNQSFVEEFDSASAALSRGWLFRNASDSIGSGVWQDGGEINPWFQAFSNYGNKAGFIGADYTSTRAQSAVISNWLLSPSLVIQNGDRIIFYTRAVTYPAAGGDTTDYGNRLQVCINPFSDFPDVGSGLSTGRFEPIYTINPTLVYSSTLSPKAEAYPTRWTRFEVIIKGLSKPTRSRFAFRYFVEDGGSNGNASGVAIDQVTYVSVSK